jgi:hypothetical protein
VLGKRSRSADGPDDLPWLIELHSKIWNKERLRPELFREVKVTYADYTALQELLKERRSGRHEPDDNGSKPDVLSVKLTFLRSRSSAKGSSEASSAGASSSRHSDPNDDDEENTAIKSLFPYLLTFLDMSPLELKEMSPSRFTSPLLYRKEYEDISELIKKKPRSNEGSVIVSGQPGLGEFLVSLSHRI